MWSLTFAIGIVSIICLTYPICAVYPLELEVLERLPSIPHGWSQGDAVPASRALKFRIAVKQENAFVFEQHVIDISTPSHSKYGQHMAYAELKDMLRPTSEATESIVGWLKAEGVPVENIEDDGDWIHLSISTATAERLFDTKSVSLN